MWRKGSVLNLGKLLWKSSKEYLFAMIFKILVYVNGFEISRTHKGKAQASVTGTTACLSRPCFPSKKRQQTNAHDVRCTGKNCCTTACSGNKVAEARRPPHWHQESCPRNHKE
ncbi:hypothetical protein FR483_n776L [Paramecium bursaria Chlorella virus FR483]|uniref:Uncharacterized protein n776L n=1 Tax=Paramecium bursaria Chlorella virus FR483 TaxID=399781 RepID=A7J8D0_PBCVF|nr:hypothetical protein FR483_n776L [Paramecium bursaria Chlorella virus FR483]ABT16061.1 hypothetical protein FR483_n776L [Paramecium bursaria Chlorella virus FR483]